MKKHPEKLTTKLSELNVKAQVINLCKNPIVQKAWNDGQELYIHGLLFYMETGLVKDLKTMKKEWRMIEDIYALEF
jgi:carbonic anhydrase